MAGKYRKFSPEFREEAARMVVETSRAIADVARELGINETSLGNWVRAYREQHAEHEPPLQVSERARLRELERLNRELEMENAFLKKQPRTSRGSIGERQIRVHRRRVRRHRRGRRACSRDHVHVQVAGSIKIGIL